MILQALHAYYQRRQNDPDPARHLPAFGLEQKEIAFILELSRSGELKNIADTRQLIGTKKVGTPRRVPQGAKKTSGIAANLLWDNAEYVLALPDAKKLEAAQAKGKEDEYRARLLEMQAAFRARIEALPAAAQNDVGIQAVLAFLSHAPGTQAERFAVYADIAASNPVLTLRLIDDDGCLISERPAVAPCVLNSAASDEPQNTEESPLDVAPTPASGWCLVTGEQHPIERLHTSVKGVWGAQTSGANIVSFNLDAFNSYGKAQGLNAPVSKAAAFAYTTALNALLSRNSTQRVQVGDASTVFWAQTPDPLEDWLAVLVGTDDPDANTRQVKALYEAVHTGQFSGARGENLFYVLGLSPNAARIAIRFWHSAALKHIAADMAQWFRDLTLDRAPQHPEHPGLRPLLRSVVLQRKDDNIPPGLGGDVLRAIVTGGALPPLWLNLAVQRCRAEQDVPYLRAAVIKACLNRSIRQQHPTQEEFTAMLDPTNVNPAYRLGRLFAVLEKIQEESSEGGLNSTIRDRYYGAASSSPASVFPTLLKLKNHHVRKLQDKGKRMLYRAFQNHQPDDYIAQVLLHVYPFPAHLSLQHQGVFALGYYHQRQAFFKQDESADAAGTAATPTQELSPQGT
jgi:CRISPR-associated protein Csd1